MFLSLNNSAVFLELQNSVHVWIRKPETVMVRVNVEFRNRQVGDINPGHHRGRMYNSVCVGGGGYFFYPGGAC
jgi:hypothetical protein